MLAKAMKAEPRPIDPAKFAWRMALLERMGIIQALENGAKTSVLLPGNQRGITTGITTEGLVIVEGWDEPFNPRAIKPA